MLTNEYHLNSCEPARRRAQCAAHHAARSPCRHWGQQRRVSLRGTAAQSRDPSRARIPALGLLDEWPTAAPYPAVRCPCAVGSSVADSGPSRDVAVCRRIHPVSLIRAFGREHRSFSQQPTVRCLRRALNRGGVQADPPALALHERCVGKVGGR
jgi:hypothetical protein